MNFYNDHTKVIISKPDHSCLVTYINRERNSYTYKLCTSVLFIKFATAAQQLQSTEAEHSAKYGQPKHAEYFSGQQA